MIGASRIGSLLRGGPELKVCLWLLLISTAIWGFVDIADNVMEGDTEAFDRKILLAMRDPVDLSDPRGPEWFEDMWRDFSALGGLGVLSLMTLMTTGYLRMVRYHRLSWFVIAVAASACIMSFGLKEVFDRDRPDLVPSQEEVYTASFPSGHTMMSTSVYLTLGVLLAHRERRFATKGFLIGCAVLLSFLVGVSRVYLGVHWPTDVLAGWAAGAAWSVALGLFLWWMRDKGWLDGQPVVTKD